MHAEIAKRRPGLMALCRRHGVARLEVFGSAARRDDFDHEQRRGLPRDTRNDLAAFTDFKDALETLLGRPVDLLEREAIEASRNFIRRRHILAEAEAVYG